MTTNGTSADAFAFNFGFANQQGKYLTAEKFGYKVNASAASLKAKQVWSLVTGSNPDEVYLQSHLKMFLASDKYGNLTCDSDEQRADARFQIEYSPDGLWAFKNITHSTYLGGEMDMIHCKSQRPEWWYIQLAIHPQVNMYNMNRKRYAHLVEDEVHGDELIPWGSDSLITLDYVDHKYGIKTCDNRYAYPDGTLRAQHSPEGLYTMQIKSGGIAFRASDGRFLTNVGPTATLKARNKNVTKDELFLIKDSHPQCYFVAHNSKKCSIKYGLDVGATEDSDEISDKEIFQLEFDNKSKNWRIRTSTGKYWSVEGTGVQDKGDGSGPNTLFSMETVDKNVVNFKSSNGKYVTAKMNGSLAATADSPAGHEQFKMCLLNRPIIILKGEYGFCGLKGSKIDCSRPNYDTFLLTQSEAGDYYFQASNGKYWSLDDGTVVCVVDTQAAATPFQLSFIGQSKLTITAPNGQYLRGENNGTFAATGREVKNDTKYEF